MHFHSLFASQNYTKSSFYGAVAVLSCVTKWDDEYTQKWDEKWDEKEKPADNQRVTVVLGRIELPTQGFSVLCSTI